MAVRYCPRCKTERPLQELLCHGHFNDAICGWDLSGVALTQPGSYGERPTAGSGEEVHILVCPQGHPVEVGDLYCPICSQPIIGSSDVGPCDPFAEIEIPSGWRIVRDLTGTRDVRERYLVVQEGTGQHAVITKYQEGAEPDQDVYAVLQSMDIDHIPHIIEFGRVGSRPYEITEYMPHGNIGALAFSGPDDEKINVFIDEIGRALDDFSNVGLRHRDLRPSTVLIRNPETLDLVVDGFGSARLSDFDLDKVPPLETTRYMAPEAVMGVVAPASDWWSLGMLLLEKLTHGGCFDGVSKHAFNLHVMAKGAPIPRDLPPRYGLLLRGLLARDPEKRWQWREVKRWLEGESPLAPADSTPVQERLVSPIRLGENHYSDSRAFALAAAESDNWDAAKSVLISGRLTNWLEDLQVDSTIIANLRTLRSRDLSEDDQLTLALKVINPDMPLIRRGEIVTPGWLIANPQQGNKLISGPVVAFLDDYGAEKWLVDLNDRKKRCREIASYHEIALSEERFLVNALSTSLANLKALWQEQRDLFPDTAHHGLSVVADRRPISVEDLIILLSAEVSQFRTLEEVLDEAETLASSCRVDSFDRDESMELLRGKTKKDIFGIIENRIVDFGVCGVEEVDRWADQFRLEHRLTIARALVLLSLPASSWSHLPGQRYVQQVISFFEQKISFSIRQGPLSRMTIAKTSQKIDLFQLGSGVNSAEGILNQLLERSESEVSIGAEPFLEDPFLERRLRGLERKTSMYRRDTGIDGLYLGFPFLLLQMPGTNTRPKISPVLLWPVKLKMELGMQGHASLAFDTDREEVRLNPALESFVGPGSFERWKTAAESLLSRQITVRAVMDEFGRLTSIDDRELSRLPGINVRVEAGKDRLSCSAVLFHAAFMGQAIVEDLRALGESRIDGSALESIIRIGSRYQDCPKSIQNVSEVEKFFSVASDPSQEAAVLDSRVAPGIVVSGPPGTGKSQTIVNIVGDAIGNRKKVLIVCQKQAALTVVQKRLQAEGLADRIVLVNDVNKDRKPIINEIRQQVAQLKRDGLVAAAESRARDVAVAKVEKLEAELDSHHSALHKVSTNSGLTYRQLINELVAIEEGAYSPPDCLSLRTLLSCLTRREVEELEEEICPIGELWLKSRYEKSQYEVVNDIGWDDATINDLKIDIQSFYDDERARVRDIKQHPSSFDVHEIDPCLSWTKVWREILCNLKGDSKRDLSRWIDLFTGQDADDLPGVKLIRSLQALIDQENSLTDDLTDEVLRQFLLAVETGDLQKWEGISRYVVRPHGLLAKLNPLRWLRTKKLKGFLQSNELNIEAEGVSAFKVAAELELGLRPLRKELSAIQSTLQRRDEPTTRFSLHQLRETTKTLKIDLEVIQNASIGIFACPLNIYALNAAKSEDANSLLHFFHELKNAFTRYLARKRSRKSLARLNQRISDKWISGRDAEVKSNSTDIKMVEQFIQNLDTLKHYLVFRFRSKGLSRLAMSAFAEIRNIESELDRVAEESLEGVFRSIVQREARLEWKKVEESVNPILLISRREQVSKVKSLEKLDRELRGLNRQLIANNIDSDQLLNRQRWDDITRLSGPRRKSLREFLASGSELGLLEVRPIWLMNPEVASKVLPRSRGLFDMVVFDEASQMPVEHSLATLYRANRCVISGDEKQLPPTSFFSSKIEMDEAEIFEGEMPEDATEEEIEAIEEAWNQREIKDCPDLLALAMAVLPTSMLEIHYRSMYRELIAFSNNAYYAGRLNVPAQHPDQTVIDVKPIELIRVDGLYENQTNVDEARRVVSELERLWSEPPHSRPSIGVVSFNRKQADLILEELDRRAEEDDAFRKTYAEEQERKTDGEDMGVFVKNVESVQGDERDIIIFSSTFGRNRQGTFRRNFGVLGQKGGERRLNVAITRAREKVILITSIPTDRVSDFLSSRRRPAGPRDYLQAYLQYAESISRGDLDAARSLLARLCPATSQDSMTSALAAGFSKTVADFISEELQLEPVVNQGDSAFDVDLAIVDPRTGLFGIGIECDSPSHPLLQKARAREVWRQSVLSRSIPGLYRVSSYGWYHDRDSEKAMLKDAISTALN